MNKVVLHEKLASGKIELDLDNPALSGIVGLERIATRELDLLRAKHPNFDSLPDNQRARKVFDWITPGPRTKRHLNEGGMWVRRPMTYHSEQVFDFQLEMPQINCFGFVSK